MGRGAGNHGRRNASPHTRTPGERDEEKDHFDFSHGFMFSRLCRRLGTAAGGEPQGFDRGGLHQHRVKS